MHVSITYIFNVGVCVVREMFLCPYLQICGVLRFELGLVLWIQNSMMVDAGAANVGVCVVPEMVTSQGEQPAALLCDLRVLVHLSSRVFCSIIYCWW